MSRILQSSVRYVNLTDRIAAFLQSEGVQDAQTAWELALDLEEVLKRLIEANRDVVTK